MLPGDRIERITIERIKPISERLVLEQAHAKETKQTLAAEVKPRKKSSKAERLLAEYYAQVPEPEPTPDESKESPVPDQPDQGEAAPDEAAPDEAAPDEAAPDEAAPDEAAPDEAKDADKRESLPSDGEALPDDHEKKPTEAPIKEGEKVEFEASPDED
jgi:hypothetical protein